ncbi:MAG: cell surface protein SprA [Candidatus Methylacidiphilales bacterium]
MLSKIPKLSISNLSLFAILGSMTLGLVSTANVRGTRNRTSRAREKYVQTPPDSTFKADSTTKKVKMPFPIKDKKPWETDGSKNPFDLNDPPNIKTSYELDKEKNQYNYSSKVGDYNTKLPASESFKERLANENKKANKQYFNQRSQANNFTKGSGLIPPIVLPGKVFDKIFGSSVIDIRPRGNAELIFSYRGNEVRNPAFSLRQQSTSQFDFQQKIQLNVSGSVGDKVKVNMNYDTEATFEFENQMKLDYAGKEDDIIKKIELGNVGLPLNSSLIQGSQSLFGVKTTMQFGRLTATAVVSQQRGRSTETELQGGATNTKFDIQSSSYDMNRHFFLSQYFYENFDNAVGNLPIINSRVNITRIEVWVTNRTNAFDNTRDVLGLADLGEASQRINKYWTVNSNPQDTALGNQVNGIWGYLRGRGNLATTSGPITNQTAAKNLSESKSVLNQIYGDESVTGLKPLSQYMLVGQARQLNQSEYTFNPRLGFISLNQALNNDDVLMVAFSGNVGGIDFQVGEFSADKAPNPATPNVLFLKMLKGPSQRPDLPTWKLMMKNVYSLGSFGIQPTNFKLNIVYADDPSGADLNYLPVKNEPLINDKALLNVFNLDKMNLQQERVQDGVFDYVEGVTVLSQTGRIILPSVEPFGKFLKSKFVNNPTLADYYCYSALYDSTRFAAIQLPQFDKFFLRGTYQGQSNSEISVGSTNLQPGSVRVTANGAPLTENVDYTVDYSLGRVRIVNTALLNSGAAIKVTSEGNSLFNVQQRTLVGTRLDYKVHKDFLLGSTFIYMNEKPLTRIVNVGEEPISNLVVGIDGSYKRDSRFLTKMVDKLPFISTKAPSSIAFNGEYAQLIPGINSALSQGGTGYIDNFENSEIPFDLKTQNNWFLASTPQGQPDLFPEGNVFNSLQTGTKRAKLAWYMISTSFHNTNDPFMPQHIKDNPATISRHNVRQVLVNDIFKGKQIQPGLPNTLPTFDLSFYPNERGPYNYNTKDLLPNGRLDNPQSNWGGVMRKIDQNDFEQSNIDYIEIWLQNPYEDNPLSTDQGQLYINLGNVSEDILRDNRRAAENGLAKEADSLSVAQFTDNTVWGRVPKNPVINYAFDADAGRRLIQDVGLDGLDDATERQYFDSVYLRQISTKFGPTSTAYTRAAEDPSGDNYHYYLGGDFDGAQLGVLDRYKDFNQTQGNSPVIGQGRETAYPTAATNQPDVEDINKDFTTNDIEAYFQYKIDIAKDKFVIGRNYVTDSVRSVVKFANLDEREETWYQLKIPVREFQKQVGDITDFKSVRFMRMFMRGFKDSTVLRFGYLQLVRADWRKYVGNLEVGGEHKPVDPTDNTQFVVSTVNVEKNSNRTPIAYTTPPGIDRQIDFSSPASVRQNEQSLSLLVCNLKDGDARAAFKNATTDMRQYAKLRMFVHAESAQSKSGDLRAFIRFGTDMVNNYYEYEIPLNLTLPGASDAASIWANEMVITLEDLVDAKIARNNANWAFTLPYSVQKNGAKITVVGMPDFSQSRVFMLGIRNPKKENGSTTDNGLPICGEVWFNELRMTEFNTRGGWAANGRLQAKLADLGNVQLTGSIITNGWGGVDKKLQQRALDDTYRYDVTTNFELGKFFPTKSGLSIPFFFSYGNTIIRPYYNPLNPDTRLQKELDQTTNQERKTFISRATDDYTSQRAFNFTNVRKNRVGSKKAHPWDIENFSATYSFNETFRRNQQYESYLLQIYQTVLSYNYTFTNKPFEPFSKLIKSKHLSLIKDININFMPSNWGFRAQVDRRYGETINRVNDNSGGNIFIPAFYDKLFTMRRTYDLGWQLTKSIRLDYNAIADARIDEPNGRIDDTQQAKRDTIYNNLWKGGRLTQFDQNIRASYNVPINKIPFLDFITQSNYSYTVNYQWKQAPPAADSLGNTIQNSRQQQINVGASFVTLYNKVKFLRDINNPTTASKPKPKAAPKPKDKKSTDKKTVSEDEVDEKGPAELNPIAKSFFKLLMGVKNVTGSYSLTDGTTLPGFKPKPNYLGQNNDLSAPGFGFILGDQSPDFRYNAAKNGWLANDSRMNNIYAQNISEKITGSITIDPIEDLRITLTVERSNQTNTTSIFRFNDLDSSFKDFGLQESGSFSTSYNTWNTAFSTDNDRGISSVFTQFEQNRKEISERLATERFGTTAGLARDSFGYVVGYSRNSQEVLIPAFLSAYSGNSASSVGLSPFPKLPLPNWNINYNGLSKLDFVKRWASNVSFSHRYSSNYIVSNFLTPTGTGRDTAAGETDIQSKYIIRNVSISERFAPLIGVEVTLVNNLTTSFRYNKDRTLNLALGSRQLNEQLGEEISFGLGYRTKKMKIPLGRTRQIVLDNDINFRVDFSIRENVTKIRNLDRESNEPVSGQTIYSFRPSVEYQINDKLQLRIFYDRRQTNPLTSNQFPTVISSGGFSLRYTIQ